MQSWFDNSEEMSINLYRAVKIIWENELMEALNTIKQ